MAYVLMALAALVGVPEHPVAAADGWQVQSSINPMDDRTQVAARKRGVGIDLILWCDNRAPAGEVTAEVHIDKYLGSSDQYAVAYRVDANEPVLGKWQNTSAGLVTTIYPSDQASMQKFVSDVAAGSKLAVQAATYDRNARGPVRVLSIAGAARMVDELRAKCVEAAQ